MNEYAGREQEIAAVAQEWAQAKVIGGKARYEQLVREDIPYPLAQLREAQKKLAAVEEAAVECGVACYVHTVLHPKGGD